MWAKAKLKTSVAKTDIYFQLADNVGFGQCLAGDIIVVGGNPRTPEQMFVIGFDETQNLIEVQRGHNGTMPFSYKRGTPLKLFRVLNSNGSTEMALTDVEQEGGATETDVITQSKLIYDWQPQDTCLPGCYYLELKLLKMVAGTTGSAISLSSPHVSSLSYSHVLSYPTLSGIVPSVDFPNFSTLGCGPIPNVEWVRRFPADKEGYLVEIVNSPTSEIVF
jgi:hypothetical protein